METDRLKYFCAIVDTGSATKASQLLGISHSGLSKAMAVLEAETERTLFRPQGRGLEVTKEGKWLYARAQELLRQAHEIKTGNKIELTSTRIGLSEAMAISCAGHVAAQLKERVEFVEAPYSQIEQELAAQNIDFGIAFVPSPQSQIEYLPIGEVVFNSYGRVDLLAQYALADLPYVVPRSDFPSNMLSYKARDTWPSTIPRNIQYSVTSFSIGLAIVKAGQGATYMPDFVARLENSLRPTNMQIVKVKGHGATEARRKIYLVKDRSSPESAIMKKVTKVIRNLCCERSRTPGG
jgi:DNA-binding transcriptional LysR family regulator